MKPQSAKRLLEQNTDSEARGMREKPWRSRTPKGMNREAEGPAEIGVTRFKAERGLEQKVIVNGSSALK